MFISCRVFRFRVSVTHHRLDHFALALPGIDQEQVLAILNRFMKLTQLLIFHSHTQQHTQPATGKCGNQNHRKIRNNRYVRAEYAGSHDEKGSDHTDAKPEIGTKESGTQKIQGFDVVAGMDPLSLTQL